MTHKDTPLTDHPIAALFPMMAPDEYAALRDDIAAHGQREPITILDGQILDGRNRYKACRELGLVPETRAYDGPSDTATLVQYVLSLNLHRRHLTSSQLAVVALDVEEMLAAEAKERQRQAGGDRKSAAYRGSVVQLIAQPIQEEEPEPLPFDASAEREENKARTQAAAIVGTNRSYVSDAKKLKNEAPDLIEQVRTGDMPITKARQELKRRTAIEKAQTQETENTSLPQQHRAYRVIYADPPWKYGNTMPDYFDEQAHHYPLMTFQEIAAMPVREMAMDDAVLFLWITSPILYDAKPVIDAWGFTYKAMFVWDKQKHNMGHYNSVRHELLLICVRGSCQPDERQLFDSVQSIERTKHSAKPEEFRTIIDTLYPHGPRIELFARRQAEGWDAYGNQVPGQPESEID